MAHALVDRLARALSARRSRRAVGALLGGAFAAPVLPERDLAAKKKKKCAKKCTNGCCTGKFGKCIQPAQQSATRCGGGGAICQRSGCPECTTSLPCPAGTCCSGAGTCGACLVFATNAPENGALGGLTGADAICQQRASAAGLPGTYLAWLSDGTGSPSTRFIQATVPYTLVDGSTVAANWTDLTDGTLAHAINRTETGGDTAAISNPVWTNTLPSGVAADVTAAGSCTNWTSSSSGPTGNVGSTAATNGAWTDAGATGCNFSRRLYCFQQR